MEDNIVEKVGQALEYLDKGSIQEIINSELIRYIPLYILKTRISATSLLRMWDSLTENQKSLLEKYLPCFEHYNRPECRTHIDGPPPPVYRCPGCINVYE